MPFTFSRIDPGTLREEERQIYQTLTTPDHYPMLRGLDIYGINNTQIIAVEALHNSQPIGLLLASFYKYTGMIEIFSLFVLPEFRHQKVATKMMAFLHQEAKNLKAKLLTLAYTLEEINTPYLEKILDKQRWQKHDPFIIRCRYLGKGFAPDWIYYKTSFPPDYTEIPWSQLSAQDLEYIKKMENQGAFPVVFSPFFEQDRIEPLNSLALKFEGNVVGWMVTHRISPDTIRYSSFFMIPELRKHLFSTKLLVDAIHLQKNSPVTWALFELPLQQVQPAWIHFIKRRLIPYADEVTHLVQASCII